MNVRLPAPPTPVVPEVPRFFGDLDEIEKRGVLRVLVRRSEVGFLARQGLPWLHDIEDAEAFAEQLGLKVHFVLVDRYDELFRSLNEGKGDLIAAQLTITEARRKQVAFARSVLGIQEIVVQRAGTKNGPTTQEDLNGRRVIVQANSLYAETLASLKDTVAPDLDIVFAPANFDTEAILERVAMGDGSELTVVDSHLLTGFEAYIHGIERLFALKEKGEIAWAVRHESVKLRQALDRFTFERAMASHKERIRTGDLADIKRRGVLRVLTRNNASSYYLYRGRPLGFEYELARLLAKDLGVRLEMVVPPKESDLIPWLLEGRGDVIAAAMTVTAARRRRVVFSRPYLFTREVLVGRKGAAAPDSLAQLGGKTVYVSRFSSYEETLKALMTSGVRLRMETLDEARETEAILASVGQGTIPWTVADDLLVRIEQAYGIPIEASLVLAPRGGPAEGRGLPIAYAVRPGEKELLAALNRFVKRRYRGLEYNVAKKRYYENRRTIERHRKHRLSETGEISPYDSLFKKYATLYRLDWRLLAAQAFVESRFNPQAKSWVGAVGLFQVMPRTGRALGFTNLGNPDISTHAGAKYMARLLGRFEPKLPFPERVRFALASYNAGLGHVIDARRLAGRVGLDPDRWFQNVEKAMLMLSRAEYARQARHGFCRGSESVAYVSHIQDLYDAYVEVTKE